MAEITSHRGVVVEVHKDRLGVRVNDDCRCEGCAIVNFCGTKNNDSVITLETPHAPLLDPGDVIEFEPAVSSQWLGIFYAFVAPVVVILVVSLLVLRVGWSELLAVLLSLGCLAVYFAIYGLLYHKGMLRPIKWNIKVISHADSLQS